MVDGEGWTHGQGNVFDLDDARVCAAGVEGDVVEEIEELFIWLWQESRGASVNFLATMGFGLRKHGSTHVAHLQGLAEAFSREDCTLGVFHYSRCCFGQAGRER